MAGQTQETARQANQYPWQYGLFIGANFVALAVFQSFIGNFYRDARGIEGTQLLWLLVALPAVSMLTQPLWGFVGDRMRYRNTALYLMALGSMLSILLMGLSKSFPMLLLCTCLYASFYTPLMPMGDSVMLEALAKKNMSFGPIRLIGSMTFAVASLLFGFVFEGRFHLVPWVSLVFCLLLLASVRVLPKAPGHQRGRTSVPFKTLFQLPHMKQLLILLTLLMLSMGYYYSYFTLHFTSLPGGTAGLAGMSYFLSAVCELPFLLRADKLFKRYGAGRLMLVSALLLVIRFTLLAFTKSVGIAVLTQMLHGGCFIVITMSTALYVNSVVPDELRASGQMLLSIVGYGLARVFGIVCGGFIANLTGGSAGGFAAMALVALVALVWGGSYFLGVPPVNGENNA